MSYARFLRSRKWREFRKQNIQKSCERCGSCVRLELHHTTYKKGLLNSESVITLCDNCHTLEHKDDIKKKLEELAAKLSDDFDDDEEEEEEDEEENPPEKSEGWIQCPKCGHLNFEDFCDYCGEDIE